MAFAALAAATLTKPMPAMSTAACGELSNIRWLTAAAIRLTDNALLARQHRRCQRADATSSPGLEAALHPIFDEMAILAVR
jgi:hypothetical protein